MDLDRKLLEDLIRRVIISEMQCSQNSEDEHKIIDSSGVGAIKLKKMKKRVKMDTGNPNDEVYTTDFFTLEEAPRIGAGLMEMIKTTFPWTLTYDEVDYIIQGRLEIIIEGRKIIGEAGDVILIPKGSKIKFSAPDYAKFIYVVYPANWSELK